MDDNVPGVEDSDDDGEEDVVEGKDGLNYEEQIRAERVTQLSQNMTQAQSIRLLFQLLTAEAKKCIADQVIVSLISMCITLIIDYCQNLHMPSFMKDQPGETYFYILVNVYALGIVNCNNIKDFLHVYMYTGKEGGKTVNSSASLLMKHLKDNGLLDGNTQLKLTVVFDNCPNNKSNCILCLAPFLVHKGYFEEVGFIFLVAGHTKNSAERLFNLLKTNYWSDHNYCISQLLQSSSKNKSVNAIAITWTNFFNWESFNDSI